MKTFSSSRHHRPTNNNRIRKPNVYKRRGNNQRQRPGRSSSTISRTYQHRSLEPIRVSSSSIHNNWKTELGGIIRFYVNNNDNHKEAMKNIERMYFTSACNIQKTKDKILVDLLGASKKDTSEWVDVSMAIEKDNSINSASVANDDEGEIVKTYESTLYNDGLKLKNEVKAGEGPAHAHEQWTNVIVPSWAVGRSYFFQMTNNSPLNLSCEMTIDEHKVARNVPIPAHSTRYVRPDNARYFQTHKWVIQPAKKLTLQDSIRHLQQSSASSNVKVKVEDDDQIMMMMIPPKQKIGKRFNNIRPNYNGQRVNPRLYPDPSNFGWTFTGSNETSRVEFFEKNVNLGIVKLDFYYTTATLKTTLFHPSTGRNCLFRNTVTPDIYVQILMNPRCHTNRGYRDSTDRPLDNTDLPMMDDFDDDNVDSEKEEEGNTTKNDDTRMENPDTNNDDMAVDEKPCPNFARNDNYDFTNDGHANRASAMAKLQQTRAFTAWEDAARKDWACIHAKFYVSLPKRSIHSTQFGKRRVKNIQQEDLPQQAYIMDVKAAERATLGTEFHATGVSQPKKRSNIVMKRINGLNDNENDRAAPIFEYKLYYRPQDDKVKFDDDDEDDLIFEEDIDSIGSETNNDEQSKIGKSPLVETLVHGNNLDEYKKEKSQQIQNWYQTSTFEDPDEAEFVVKNRIESIEKADTVDRIEVIVNEFYQWFQKSQWNKKSL